MAMEDVKDSFMLFSGTSHPRLAKEICKELGVPLGQVQIDTFPDGEIGVQILENVRGRDVFVVQSIARRPNLYLMELLILIDAFKRASARSIVAVIPYYGYSRQDRKDKGRVPITAKLVANLLEKAGATRVLTMDLHADQIQGFFDIPVDNLFARPVLVKAAKRLISNDCVVVTPDVGSIKLARSFARDLNVELAIVDKRRLNAEEVEMNALIGNVEGKDVLLIDDICSTGGTLRTASWVCKKARAKRVISAVTHGLFLGSGFQESAIETMIVSNTIPIDKESINGSRIEVVSAAGIFAMAIESIVEAKSISSLFENSK
ncbi:MAG: ribose-phosphate pyrophosphokinase [Simkaniaceae bacterium]